MRPGQPEPRPALGSAGRGCRRAGCGNRQRRRRRATAAAVTGKIVQGERRTTEKVVVHAGKPGGSEDAAAASSATAPMETALWRACTRRKNAREGEWRGEWGLGQLRHSVEAAGARQRVRARGSGGRQWWRRAPAWLPRMGQVPPVEAFHRARGGQRRGQGGTLFWAVSRPN